MHVRGTVALFEDRSLFFHARRQAGNLHGPRHAQTELVEEQEYVVKMKQ